VSIVKITVYFMKKIKKWLRLLAFVVLVVLALVGVGIAGAPVPPPQSKKDEKIIEVNVEMVDDEENDEVIPLERKQKN
jgi:anionic cell wall polymer biosynthesis LytR-Cps2A-Psr (LCP) family protein